MEISSLGGMQQGMPMGGMRRPPGNPAEDAEKMSAKVMEKQDADGDGLLSTGEFDSDLLAALDTDGDGVLSQAELQTGIQSKMEEGKAGFESGEEPSAENREFMEKLHSMIGEQPPNRSKATEAYGLMQQAMFGGDNLEGAAFNADQLLLDSFSATV